MRTTVSLLFIFLVFLSSSGKNPNESVLKTLDLELAKRDLYFSQQENRIDSLKKAAWLIPFAESDKLAKAYHDIFTAYSSFQGDSALQYALKSSLESRKAQDPDLLLMSHGDMIFAHMSSGNFTDAVTVVKNTDTKGTSPAERIRYYSILARLYADLADYANNQFSESYRQQSAAYSDSLMQIASTSSPEYVFASAISRLNKTDPHQRIHDFRTLLSRKDLDPGMTAMAYSLIADAYRQLGMTDSLIFYKVQAAIFDTKAAKHETIATLDLGKILMEQGDLDRAYRYLQFAMEDAEYYNSRNRKMQISEVQNEIDKTHYNQLNESRKSLWMTLLFFVPVSILLILGIVYVIKKWRHTHRRGVASDLEKQKLAEENKQHQQKIADLTESNNIRNEYVGYGFSAHVEYIRKMESLYKMVDRRLMLKQYDELHKSLKYGDINKDRDEMHAEFDRKFLKLFPDFIEKWKALFEPDDPKNAETDGTRLTPEMRIFALIKVGISESKDIATFLGYSVNTVNTYKTKAKKRSPIPNDHFEEAIMKIGAAE